MKKLLAHICRTWFPTIDGKKCARQLEAMVRHYVGVLCGGQKLTPEPTSDPVTSARFWGHACAHVDFLTEHPPSLPPPAPSFRQVIADFQQLQTLAVIEREIRALNFQQRAVFLKEFSFAYSRTYTPLGKLRQWKKATPIYIKLLQSSAFWLVTGPPRTITELQSQWLALEQRPKPSTPLEQLRREDEQKEELKRLQQICARLGWRFLPPRANPRKHRPK